MKEILHPKYGTGKIIEILGEGMDTELVVKFIDKEKTNTIISLLRTNKLLNNLISKMSNRKEITLTVLWYNQRYTCTNFYIR